jgi:predicted O-linked N-acetylglucosamine transferase (SPINDLY family)
VLKAHLDWARRVAAGAPRRHWANDRDPQRRLRVGLVSPDLRRHPVTALCAAMLERLAPHGIDLYCYYNFPSSDVVTARVRQAATVWREVHALEDAALAAQVEADAIDILVDLAGHTTLNRLGLFARKPAPLQVSWLGYFNSTGLPTFDAFLSDPYSSPPGQDAWFVEPLLRLPHTRFCYQPWEFMPEVNALPARNAGHVSFGCFNNLAKLNDQVLSLWARVLEAVPDATLVVQAQSLNDAPNRERFASRAEALGIPRARLALRDFVPLQQAPLGYHGIDIALDPFPFCGGMTSFESLWMGVPVVTLEQPLIAGRQTLSMLHNLGLQELVAPSEDDYVRIAAGLAADLPRLETLRRELRPRFAASALADYDGFARDWAAALRGLWRQWVQPV